MPRTLRRLLDDDGGWALVTALVLMTIMIGMGLALSVVLRGQGEVSATQRQRETSFNVAEAALNAQVRAVGYRGVTRDATAPFAACTTTSTSTDCPTSDQITKLIPSVDTRAGVTWQTQVRDNTGPTPSFYDDATTGLAADGSVVGSDKKGATGNKPDGKVWVRAQATLAGRTRIMVALVEQQYQREDIIQAAVRTGSIVFGNNSPNKWYINGGTAGQVQIRCDVVLDGDPCEGLSPPSGQFKTVQDVQEQFADTWAQGTTMAKVDTTPAMSADAIQRLKDTAAANGTLYTAARGCPSGLSGQVVYLDHVSCSYTGNATDNSQQTPGMVLVDGGQLKVGGTHTFYGVLYWTETRTPAPTPPVPVIDFSGTSQMFGGLITDGNTVVNIGDSNNGATINFDGAGFQAVQSIATADVVQNTWREITK
jgi:Tfp pilus assembly protein PilX